MVQPFPDPDVESKFDSYSPEIRPVLLRLRNLILDTAAKNKEIGGLNETLGPVDS